MRDTIFKTGQRLLLLLGFFIVGLFVVQVIAMAVVPVFGEGTRNTLLCQSILQNILAFILPAWAAYRISNHSAIRDLGLCKGFTLLAVIGVFAFYLLSLPAMNQIIYWNAGMHLPASMKELEESWRKMEEINASFTETLTQGTSVWSLVSGILVMGLLTGFSEELFFRGALQGTLLRTGMRTWIAVWVTAIIFSLMHFQMFGFVPRVILGAWFGYLYVWSRSLWVPVTAHALNNTMVVIFTWLANRGVLADDFDLAGVTTEGIPWWAIRSAVLTGILLVGCRSWFRPKKEISDSSKELIKDNGYGKSDI